MDITRKNDSSATKTHLTTANKQPVCDQTQQPGETLPTGVAGGAASNKTADTYTTATTEKMADLHIDKSNEQTTTTLSSSHARTGSGHARAASTDGNGSGMASVGATTVTTNAVALPIAVVAPQPQISAQTTAVPPALQPHSQQGSACTAVALMSNVASLVNPPIQQPSLMPPAGGATSTLTSRTVQRPAVFDKLESLVQDMQDKVHGVPVRHQKVFLTSIPFAFMGYDLIEWLMDRLSIEDSLEAVHLANLLCQFGYYFPIGELKNLLVKDDSSLYRFQSPYYWPSQHHTPDNIEYAIYLAKRSQQRKREKHGLEDYEVDSYNNLKKILSNKWELVTMQAEEQLKVAKDRKKDDKHIVESQEKAYWRVYRPPPGYTTVVESSPVPTREDRVKARSKTKEHRLEEVKFLREYVSINRCRVSIVAENLIDYTDTFLEFDPMLCQPGPSNPWITDDQTHWLLNQPIVDTPTEKRVRKWELSLEDLALDPLGIKELMEYMKKEYSHENLRFWIAVQDLRYGPGTEPKIKKKVKEIWDEFLAPGAKAEINIDGKTMEATKQAMKTPTRFTFEVAAGHVYLLLLKKDCYPRFIRSENYKSILANAINPGNVRRRIFNFPKVPRRQQKSGTAPTGTGTTTSGLKYEDFNVYGIHGAGGESDSPPDGPDDPSFPAGPSQRNNASENICPWESDDIVCTTKASSKADDNIKPSSGSAGGHVRRGSDPTALISAKSCANTSSGTQSTVVQGGSNVSKTRLNPSAIGVAVASAVTAGPLDQQHSSPLVKGSSLTSKRVATSSTSSDHDKSAVNREGTNKSSPHGGHRHSADTTAPSHSHHHHHHHHHHAASRRVKNRSRKKKPSRASSSAASMETPNLTEALVGSSGMVPTTHNKHDPPKHQHSAASLLSSVAAASVAMASMDSSSSVASMVSIGTLAGPIIGTTSIPMVPTGTTNSIPPPLSTTTITGPTSTVGAVASATVSMIPTTVSSASLSTKTEPSGTLSGTMSADMETKCTQTKLDDELLEPIMGCSASFNSATSCGSEYQKTTTSSNPSTTVEQPKSISTEPKSGSAGTKSGSAGTKSGSVNEPTTTTGISEAAAGSNPAIATTSEQPSKSGPTENNPGKSGNPSTTDPSTKSGVPPAENPKSGSAATATESKGEIGTWTSSTEVCPWEDDTLTPTWL